MNLFFINLLLAMIWTAMTGNLTLPNLVAGFVFAYLVLFALRPFFGATGYFRKLPKAVGFVLYFVKEMLVSSVRVAWDVITPAHRSRPGIVAIPLEAQTPMEITLLANAITLTPGTLSLDLSEDQRVLYIHAMFVDDPDALRREIKTGLEARLLELFR